VTHGGVLCVWKGNRMAKSRKVLGALIIGGATIIGAVISGILYLLQPATKNIENSPGAMQVEPRIENSPGAQQHFEFNLSDSETREKVRDLQAKVDKIASRFDTTVDVDQLLLDYPGGFVLFYVDGRQLQFLPGPTPTRMIEAKDARIEAMNDRVVSFRTPNVVEKGGAVFWGNLVTIPRVEGERFGVMGLRNGWIQVLADEPNGVAWVLGFTSL